MDLLITLRRRLHRRLTIRDRDIATSYLRLILEVIDIKEMTVITAGGSKVVDLGEKSREDFLSAFAPAVSAASQG